MDSHGSSIYSIFSDTSSRTHAASSPPDMLDDEPRWRKRKLVLTNLPIAFFWSLPVKMRKWDWKLGSLFNGILRRRRLAAPLRHQSPLILRLKRLTRSTARHSTHIIIPSHPIRTYIHRRAATTRVQN